MSAMPVIECAGITLYRNGYKVLDSVNARLPAGDFVAMVGPNGAGKTTLLKVLLGLLEADAGEVRLFGQRAAKWAFRYALSGMCWRTGCAWHTRWWLAAVATAYGKPGSRYDAVA